MSRIEDNEAERMERARQDRKLQEQQTRTKQLAEGQQFRAFVAKGQETKKQDTRGDQQRSEQNQQASRNLLARRGIDANRGSERMAASNAANNEETRTRLGGKDRERNRLREELGEREHAAGGQQSGRSDPMGIGRSGSRGGDKDRGSGGEQRGRDVQRSETAPSPAATTSYAAIGQAAVQALDGMGARASGRSLSAADQAEKIRAMLDAIVKGVKQGMDKEGFGLIEVTLNDDVLGGTKLTVLHGQSGVHLKIDTGEHGAAQHERPNETLLKASAGGLMRAMERAKVKLVGLEINGEKV